MRCRSGEMVVPGALAAKPERGPETAPSPLMNSTTIMMLKQLPSAAPTPARRCGGAGESSNGSSMKSAAGCSGPRLEMPGWV